MFMHVILDVHSLLYSILESRISSKTHWRMLWRLKGECPLPVYLLVWNFAQNFLDIYICHSWQPKSSRLQSGIKNFLQDSLKEALDPHRRMNLKFWHFSQSFLNVYIYHSWRPKSSGFYSGIKNVLRVSLVDALETHSRFSSSLLIC